MIALATDEDFNHDIVRGLLRREPSINIVNIRDAGLGGADIQRCLYGVPPTNVCCFPTT